MSRIFDCKDPAQREEGLRTATAVIGRGALVVLPTDTVYGVAADAFNPGAVQALLAAKGRGRQMPPPVLVAGVEVLAALTSEVTEEVRALAEAFWPGGLTIICWAQPSLAWDLGDTGGTVAIRVPDHPMAIDLLRQCGPLATSSANLSGHPVASTAAEAQEMLGSAVEVYLDEGALGSPGSLASTIVDATGDVPKVVRVGAISVTRLREVVPTIEGEDSSTLGVPGPVTQGDADTDDPQPSTGAASEVQSEQAEQQDQPPRRGRHAAPSATASGAADEAGTFDARAALRAHYEATEASGQAHPG